MQVNAKLEEKDKALQNVSKHCYIIRQKMKKYSTLLPNLFHTQARNKFHLQIYSSLVTDHEDQIFTTFHAGGYICKLSVHETSLSNYFINY